MGTSKLTVTHPDVTRASLDAYLSRQCPRRVKLRIAILQDVMDKIPIYRLSRRRKMSRQGIYNLVSRINERGIEGLEDQHLGRPSKLTADIAEDLKRTLIHSPAEQGYIQPQWDNGLLRRYLKDRHGIDIGRAQLINWLNAVGTPVKLARKKYEKADPDKRSLFLTNLMRLHNLQPEEFTLYGGEAAAKFDSNGQDDSERMSASYIRKRHSVA